MDAQREFMLPQLWHGRTVQFTSLASDNCLDLFTGSADAGTRVCSHSRNGSGAQQWRLFKTDLESVWSAWAIQNVASGTWLDLAGGMAADCTKIQGYPSSLEAACRNQNQQWHLTTEYLEASPVVRFANKGAFTYVDVIGGERHDGSDSLNATSPVFETDIAIRATVAGYHRGDHNRNQLWKMCEV
ncbi:hypothetical protein DOTSEDRAFT_25087 [Dothistroma septosporum NZE10]|uniref:Ricin B lectin domain-containing protein n=1 Tax=Dothistroma septosporum (strain NZE10 / CBS 128990) TaxID=675120 RepID=M2XKS4_DOTSN|nr:hypothetical protein DOTSEDRAFT_25087 [Dothistroma septosporum NZE10]